MPDVDALLSPAARYFVDEVATPAERQRIEEIIDTICYAPASDDVLRFPIDVGTGPSGGILYHDGRFWLLYRMTNAWTLEVIGMGTVEDVTS